MTPSSFGIRSFALAGFVGSIGCATTLPAARPMGRTLYPENPSPGDRLASDPCAVKEMPDLFVRDAPLETLRPLRENLQFLKDINPVFLCGLERIDLLGDAAYKASADPKYTRRSVGLYTPMDRVIHLKASAGITLTHEVGHHVHNLGYFAPTVREFLALSWTYDASGARVHRCEGPDCFISDAAASEVTEDWARTFEMVLMRPIETGVAVGFSFSATGQTPVQRKVELIRSIAKLPEPVKGTLRFGEAKEVTAEQVREWKGGGLPTALPDSLPTDTIRRIHRNGQRSIKSWVWDNQRRPFLAGDAVIFPVFRKDKKKLGFFAYDLSQDRFLPVVLKIEGLPKEFREAEGSLTDVEILPDENGTLFLIVHRGDAALLAAPTTFFLKTKT